MLEEKEKPFKVLIVDKNITTCKLLKKYFRKHKTDPYYLLGHMQILDFLKNNPWQPDIIFINSEDRTISNLTAIKLLKQSELIKNIPIVIIVPNNNIISAIEAYEAGAIDFLAKPINETILIEKTKLISQNKRLIENLIVENKNLLKQLNELKASL